MPLLHFECDSTQKEARVTCIVYMWRYLRHQQTVDLDCCNV